MKFGRCLLLAITLLSVPSAVLAAGEIAAPEAEKGAVYEGPTCDQGTINSLIGLVGDVSCLVSFDAACRMLATRALGAVSTAGFLTGPGLTSAEKSAEKQIVKNFDKVRADVKEIDPKAAKKLGTGKKFVELDAEARGKILARIEKIAAESEKVATKGIKKAIVREGITAAARKGVSWLAWSSTGVGFALTVGDIAYQTLSATPAGDCEDDNMLGTFEGVKYTDRVMVGNACTYSYAPGPHVRDFLKLPNMKQLAALRQNPQLCGYYTEMIARLKEDKAGLLKQLGEMQFTGAPQCSPNGRGVSFTVHELDKDMTYSSDENADHETTAFHVKSSNDADPDQFNFQMQTQEGVSTFATVEVQTVTRQKVKLTQKELSDMVVMHPEFTRVFQHFRRLQWWAPALSECCREKDSQACFKDLGLKTPAAGATSNQKSLSPAKTPGTP